jgi:TetR/AcrR family transcriptional regulator, regulator of autoinduction and epiphytic fitness
MEGNPTVDGRRARRERSRQAVVEAAFALIVEGKGPPAAEDVAERAGVSVSSIFRNFDGLDDIKEQALALFRERYSHLLTATPAPDADRTERIVFFVDQRLDLYGQAHPLLTTARMRAFEHDSWSGPVAENRDTLAAQTRACFATEIADRTPADAADLVALIDSLTSPEAYEVMTRAHGRTRPQIAATWRTALDALTHHHSVHDTTVHDTTVHEEGER